MNDMFSLRDKRVVITGGTRGVGRAMVDASEQLAGQLGVHNMVLHARETAVPFYLQLGYQVVGEPFEEVTIPHFKMEKKLGGNDE